MNEGLQHHCIYILPACSNKVDFSSDLLHSWRTHWIFPYTSRKEVIMQSEFMIFTCTSLSENLSMNKILKYLLFLQSFLCSHNSFQLSFNGVYLRLQKNIENWHLHIHCIPYYTNLSNNDEMKIKTHISNTCEIKSEQYLFDSIYVLCVFDPLRSFSDKSYLKAKIFLCLKIRTRICGWTRIWTLDTCIASQLLYHWAVPIIKICTWRMMTINIPNLETFDKVGELSDLS